MEESCRITRTLLCSSLVLWQQSISITPDLSRCSSSYGLGAVSNLCGVSTWKDRIKVFTEISSENRFFISFELDVIHGYKPLGSCNHNRWRACAEVLKCVWTCRVFRAWIWEWSEGMSTASTRQMFDGGYCPVSTWRSARWRRKVDKQYFEVDEGITIRCYRVSGVGTPHVGLQANCGVDITESFGKIQVYKWAYSSLGWERMY